MKGVTVANNPLRRSAPRAIAAFLAPPLALLLSLSLPGCVTPHRFTAVLTIEKNGDYLFEYIGTAYSHGIVMAMRGNQDEEMARHLHDTSVAHEVELLMASTTMRAFEYLGDGLFNVSLAATGNLRDKYTGLFGKEAEPFWLAPLPDGKTAEFVFSPTATPSRPDHRLAQELAKDLDGTIRIHSKLPIVRCDGNPERSPQGDSLVWRIKGWREGQKPPTMIVALK